jgi:hypothetical protein
MRSDVSLEFNLTCGKFFALFMAVSSALPSSNKGFNTPPCGGTNFEDIFKEF